MSRPPHAPTPAQRRQVETLSGFGIPEIDVARSVGISPNTLRLHYRDELDLGHVKANAAVARNLFKLATGPGREAVTAAIFWLKTRAGWSEFSPPVREAEMGKKMAANAAAQTAEEGTSWADLLRLRPVDH